MDNDTIFTKTAKGSQKAAGKSKALSRDERTLLQAIDGRSTLQALAERLALPDALLRERLAELAAADYIRRFASPDEDEDLDFTRLPGADDPLTAMTMGAFLRETERQAQQAAEDRISQEAAREAEAQRAQRESEERARRKAAVARIRQEALEKYRRDLEQKAQQEAEEQRRLQAEEQARQAEQEQARRAAQEQALRDAEERARQEAEDRARQLAEEQARREAELQARREAEEEAQVLAARQRLMEEQRARREAEQQAARDAKQQARREAKAHARQEAEARAQRKAEDKARRQAEREAHERALRDEQEQAVDAAIAACEAKASTVWLTEHAATPQSAESAGLSDSAVRIEPSTGAAAPEGAPGPGPEAAQSVATYGPEPVLLAANRIKHYRKPSRWIVPAVLALAAALATGMVLTQTVSFDSRRLALERAASAQWKQPVRIGAVRLAWLPQPHWRIEQVAVGNASQIRVARIDAVARLDTLFDDQAVYRSITLQSPVVDAEGLGWLLFERSRRAAVTVERISARQARLASPQIALPLFDIDAAIGADGNWSAMALDSADRQWRLDLRPQGEAVQVELRAATLGGAFGSAPGLTQIIAAGRATRDELRLSSFTGALLGGSVSGTARLAWGANWTLDGNWKAQQVNAARLAPALFESGKLDAAGELALAARSAGELFAAPRIKGEAGVRNGVLLGANLAGAARDVDSGGKTSFSELDGVFLHERGRLQLRKLRLNAGLLTADGSADIDAAGTLKGRIAVDIRASARHARGQVGLEGTLAQPRFE